MKHSMFYLLASTATLSVGCSGGGGSSSQSQDFTAVFGQVVDSNGNALSGVMVRGGGGSATTEGDGSYLLEISASSEVVLSFHKEGFLDLTQSTAVLDSKPTNLDAQLLAQATAVPLNAETGGEAEGQRGAKIVAPEGAFVSSDGASVGGMVQVHLTPLDPSIMAERTAVTTRFVGERQGGEETLIESFGMLEVTVRQDGDELQVAPGKTITISIPKPADVDEPPESMPLWHLNEATNTWEEQGTATWDEDAGAYIGEVAHMSTWNADQPLEATCITGMVIDEATDEPLAGAGIIANGVDYRGSSNSTSLDDGRFYIAVRQNSTVNVLARHEAGGGQFREVESGATPTAVPPRPGQDECKDVGEWRVTRGVISRPDAPGGGTTVSCTGINTNPFAGSCAEPLFGLFECFQPSGMCESDFSFAGGTSTISWASGHVIEFNGLGGDGFTGRYLNGQTVCATIESRQNNELLDYTINGQTFTIDTGNDEETAITCPGGATATFTQSDLESLQACGVGGEIDTSQCVGNDPEPNPQPTPSVCTNDSECAAGTVCCTFEGVPQSICYERAICDQIRAAQSGQ